MGKLSFPDLFLTINTGKSVSSSAQNLLEFFGILIIFVIVLLACYFTTKFVATKNIRQKNTGNFELIETYCIARERYLLLVRICNKYYALSATKDNVNVICEIPENEIAETKNTALKTTFSAVFDAMKKASKKESGDACTDIESNKNEDSGIDNENHTE